MVRTLGAVGQELGGAVGQGCPHLCDTKPHGRRTKNQHLPESCKSMYYSLVQVAYRNQVPYFIFVSPMIIHS